VQAGGKAKGHFPNKQTEQSRLNQTNKKIKKIKIKQKQKPKTKTKNENQNQNKNQNRKPTTIPLA
jgi:hypothetical protein